MKRSIIAMTLGVVALAELAYVMGAHAYALAAAPDATPIPTPAPSIEVVEVVPTAPPPTLTPSPRPSTPEPTATPAWAPIATYDPGEFRCLARYCHTSIPSRATMITQIVSAEVVQNRTVNDGFPSTIRYVLLSGDFGGYDPDARYVKHDRLIAEFAMRSWAQALNGEYQYRYTPKTGIYLSYSKDGRYCKVYDAKWRLVCDTSKF